MRVLMFEPTGGFEPYTGDLCETLGRQGIEVTLLTSRIRNRTKYSSYACHAYARSMNPGLSSRLSNPWNLARWAFDRSFSGMQWLWARSKVAKEVHADIIHIQSTVPLFDRFILPTVARQYRVVLTVHDVMPITDTRSTGGQRSLKSVYQAARTLVVHSENQRDELVSMFGIDPQSVRVIPHGVCAANDSMRPDTARMLLGLPNDGILTLAFGGLRQSKGLDLALKALRIVISENPHVYLVVAGAEPRDRDVSYYMELARSLMVHENVIWRIGYVPHSMVEPYFGSSDIVILPYLKFHSQSGVLLQAYRYGRAVVVTNVGALGETVIRDGTGVVASTMSPEDVAAAWLTLIENDGTRRDCGSQALELARTKYNWRNVALQHAALYTEVVRS